MKLKFKFPGAQIRTLSQQLAAEVKADSTCSNNGQTPIQQGMPASGSYFDICPELPEIITQTFRYLYVKQHLCLMLLPATILGECISATLPLDNIIAMHKDQYLHLRQAKSPWRQIVLAHELGHWILHAPMYRRSGRQLDLFDNSCLGSTLAEIAAEDKDNTDLLDQQANCFAREYLLPEDLLRLQMQQAGYYPPVIYRSHHLSFMPFAEYGEKLAEKINGNLRLPVSWLCSRLLELGLLQNHAQSELLHHIA